MDFGKLLSVAQKNNSSKQSSTYYSTKFTPPKKETKQSKNLSVNIKKFLARKEEEEKKKNEEEKRKKENLLALRDHKAQSRISKHLKVCKAANKAVLADAVNTEDTAITMAGPSQPDEDDYGYVSQEASAFYDRLMNKYNSLPPEKPLFSDNGKRVVKDISSTKDRVKQALKQQELEDSLPKSRKRKSSEATLVKDVDRERERDYERDRERDFSREKEEEKPKKKRPPPPPPMDFVTLLKLAEKKQHEPIVLDPKPKPKSDVAEFDRPMTKKQKKEFMKEKEWRDRREREKNGDMSATSSSQSINSTSTSTSTSASANANASLNSQDQTGLKSSKPSFNKPMSKVNNDVKSVKSIPNSIVDNKCTVSKPTHISSNPSTYIKNDINNSKLSVSPNKISTKSVISSEKDAILEERRKLEMEKRKLESMRRMIEEEKRKLAIESKNKRIERESRPSGSSSSPLSASITTNKHVKTNGKLDTSMSSSKDKPRQSNVVNSQMTKPRSSLSGDSVKPKQFPPADVKPRQFPPPDVAKRKSKINGNGMRQMSVNKRRIYDDDEEYDSELDDFIDDDPQGEQEDYSKYISEIFGYDKSKYRNFDDDDTNMESSYAQQLKEEFVSTKIGIMEDLEDLQKETMEKKRKAIMMKKLKKK